MSHPFPRPVLSTVALAIATVLGVVAGLHIGWAFGMVWPAQSEAALVRTVIGTPDMVQMPGRILTLVVAAGIGGAGVVALWGAGLVRLPLPARLRRLGLAVLTGIFLLRGIASYLPFGPLAGAVMPFRQLDLFFFSPLILCIGAGFWLLWRADRAA